MSGTGLETARPDAPARAGPELEVAVVAAEMEGEPTGVGRFLTGFLDGVRRLQLPWRWRLYFQGHAFEHDLWRDPRIVPVFSGHRGSRVVWEQLRLPRLLRQDPPDLVYSPGYSLPPCGGTPAVVSLHDLSFERLPEEFGFKERWRRRLLARRAAARAGRVLVDSELIRDEVARLYRVGRGRLGVVPVAVDPRFEAQADDASADLGALRELGVRQPYLLSVGTLLQRRCVPLLLEVCRRLMELRGDLRLVLAGANRLRDPDRLATWVSEAGLDGRVDHLGYVADGVLPALYQYAELSLYLSLYEGFGIPPLESLASGTPVVTAPGLGLDDLWPDYPLRCASLEHLEVFEVARRALLDVRQREEAVLGARSVLERLSPENVARAIVAELERAVGQ